MDPATIVNKLEDLRQEIKLQVGSVVQLLENPPSISSRTAYLHKRISKALEILEPELLAFSNEDLVKIKRKKMQKAVDILKGKS